MNEVGPQVILDRQVIEEFRRRESVVKSHGLEKITVALVTTVGAKTGAERISPLTYTTEGDDVIVVASDYGSSSHPGWYYNIMANPKVRVEIGAQPYEANATILTDGPERQRLWDDRVRQFPNFKEFQDKTDRLIRVVVLRRN
ncbi:MULTISPECIES: nitroreductase/quinone reductase family protein [unclassified Mycolicibacterium]|uniref:nitroreductase/quinone reductase family protein n=1 Tax=unclassified Mycolicibacterium TaxID=2636767 RepID=UPI0012DD8A4B|nr:MULTISPECIES: nitroreductase/quinone reductase family protein [unclassified Mycolicibacterium]MUL81941.1 nitroreductase family deazaflavin-dependent oxidoreductase [Mycolicibacterium sp. CBMA 329]MUL87707.1 nitroreductase family deazaflavin-dependent oxidoreductase [Mycolicibacterium sp. CBMA 331]MUL99430.1 nitroreductase family deazaflavin-dependent oxidoreductase [Mycolicibacterium sp. CBMA 334]MUM29432.1 nitroreductase family deazaflavin-dependent oxidoreductase [Mycolicibacterium sp. CBM